MELYKDKRIDFVSYFSTETETGVVKNLITGTRV